MTKFLASIAVVIIITIQGYSQINWTKHADNPIFPRGANGTWDDTFVSGPTISYDGQYYHMWYSGYDGESNGQNVGYAWSENGINWNRNEGSVLKPGATGNWDGISVFQPSVLMSDTLNQMWYCGHNSGDLSDRQIGYATSTDSIDWTKYYGNPVLRPGTDGSWDDVWLDAPDVLFIDGTYHMWYAGSDGIYTQIGHATSADGKSWEKDPLNPVLTVGENGSWDDLTVGGPSVKYDGQVFHMWYSGGEETGFDWKVGYAYSIDGSNWVKTTVNRPVLDLGEDGSWDDAFNAAGGVEVMLNDDLSQLKMWYGGGTNWAIGDIGYAATSFDDLVSIRINDVKNIARDYWLYQNYPNPFNPTTRISYSIPKTANVKIEIFNVLGSKVATLVNANKSAGTHTISFDASTLSSGVYLYRIQAGDHVEAKKMMLLR
ncbi:MAG: T9SS type A sorting domain-containing protein [Calditrichota bacterium]